MKTIALGNRLARDLSEKSLHDLTADAKQEILDAINGSLQRLNALAPSHSKTVPASVSIEAPVIITLGVTNGSYEITGHEFTAEQCYRTIRIDGDGIYNSVVGETTLFHPYAGATGTVSATLYCDAIAIPEPYGELVGDPKIIEHDEYLTHWRPDTNHRNKRVGRPQLYWIDDNARNQNPPAPVVMRLDTLPDTSYRLEVMATLAPLRITFSDLLSANTDVPMRDEHIESYLLPLCRGAMSHSTLWRRKDDVQATRDDAKNALTEYRLLVPVTTATPRNFVQTKEGW